MSNPFSLLVDEGADPADNVPTPQPAKSSASAPAAPAANKPRQQQQPRRDNNRNSGTRTPAVQGTDAGEADLSRDVRGERTAGRKFPFRQYIHLFLMLCSVKNVVVVALALVDQEVVEAAVDLEQTDLWTDTPTLTECRSRL